MWNAAVDHAVAAADAANIQIALEAEEKFKEQVTREEISIEIGVEGVSNGQSAADGATKDVDGDDADSITMMTHEDSINSPHVGMYDTITGKGVGSDAVLEALKKHNDMVLEEHKRQLEAEFQSQVQNFLSTLKSSIPLPQQQQQPKDIDMMYAHTRPPLLSRGRTPVTPQIIEERNDRILTAARSLETAPRYLICENENKPSETTAILRATIEQPSPPKHVRMSVTKGEIGKVVEPTMVVQTEEEAYFTKMEGIAKSMPHLSIYNEPYDTKGRISAKMTRKKIKKKKEDLEEVTLSSQRQNNDNKDEINDAELLGKVDNTTRHMMLKTKFLFEDSKKFIEKTKKKRKKSKGENYISNSSSLPNIDTADANEYTDKYENDGFDGEGLLPSVWSDANADKPGSYFI